VKRLSILIAAVALTWVPGAFGKGLTSVRVCGESECVALSDEPQAAHIMSSAEGVFEPPKPGPFYRLDIAIDAGTETHSFSNVFVPGEELIAANVGAERALVWYVPRTEALRLLEEATRDLEPYAAPAAWPPKIAALNGLTAPPPVTSDGANWRPWALAVGALMVALSAGGLLARRLRLRHTATA
jgi:hypothetical protein